VLDGDAFASVDSSAPELGPPEREEIAMQIVVRQRILVASVLAAGLGMSSGAVADDQKHVSGVITDHTTQGTVILQTDESSTLTIIVDGFTMSGVPGR
jgi:hypothetical protein